MLPIALAAALLAQPASRPASQPARTGASPADVYAELTTIFEVSEGSLRVQESWRIRNTSELAVAPELLTIPLPSGAKQLRLDEDAAPFLARPDSGSIGAGRPLPPGEASFGATYILPVSGANAVLARTLPFRMGGARVIFQNLGGLDVATSPRSSKRVRELNGLEFAIWDVEAMQPGQLLELRVKGLPAEVVWPRYLALATVAGILGWMVWALFSSKSQDTPAPVLGALSSRARRDRIVKAIELLDADLAAERIDEARYRRRHKALMRDLAEALREIDVEERRVKAARGAA